MDPTIINRDNLFATLQAMDRPALTRALLGLPVRFPLDFSREFLQQWSEDKLRHVLYAATTEAEAPTRAC